MPQVPISEILKKHWLQGRHLPKLPKVVYTPPPLGFYSSERWRQGHSMVERDPTTGRFIAAGVHVDPKVMGRVLHPALSPATEQWEEYRKFRSALGMSAHEYRGNLGKSEYEYWIGMPYTKGVYSTCRYCGKTAFDKSDRRKHLVDGSRCHIKLMEIYKGLRTLGKCVMCGADARGKHHYGVPICGLSCMDAWKYDQSFCYPWKQLSNQPGECHAIIKL